MQHKHLILTLFILLTGIIHAQQDSSIRLRDAEVRSYFESRSLLSTPASVSVIDAKQLRLQHDYSLVPAINTVPGVRMEERSPGSYRFSIRGSLLRSPFGIRNVKMYLDDFPLTDAGGNTYLNMLDAGNINRIEILKGPEASIFGANSGGVVVINPVPKKADSSYVLAGLSGGSYNLLHQKFVVQESFSKYRFNFTQGFQRSDGYRDNSNFKRQYVQLFQQYNYSARGQLKALFIYSNLDYRTPGGLTLSQFTDNPKASRPGTLTLRSAKEQRAGIMNKTFYGGLSHQYVFNRNIRHVITVFGSSADFENPFITNYETRNETSIGTRTYIELANEEKSLLHIKWQSGLEAQQTRSLISNYGNNAGRKDSLQAKDDLTAFNHFYFTRFAFDLRRKLFIELASSINFYSYMFTGKFPVNQSTLTQNFAPQLMPRIAFAYLIKSNLSWRASVSRGYSAPTIAEIRPSNLVTNTSLNPETGWNYESGFRLKSRNYRYSIDACIYYFELEQAIVRRLDNGGNEFFINSGGTKQTGVEIQASAWVIMPNDQRFFRGAELTNGFTYNHFVFNNYRDLNSDYSGNRLTGTPGFVNVTGLNILLPSSFSLFVQYNFTGAVPLNDANSVYANEYHLLQGKASWVKRYPNFKIEVFAGADNILNQTYSLGNDLNAFGGRYFNAAPLRNYFVGVNFILL